MKSVIAFLVVAAGLRLAAQPVRVLYDPSTPATGPFPSDVLTVPDAAQRTGVSVRMPLENCDRDRSRCEELGSVNGMDGFALQPRIHVRFSGAIDPDTLRDGIRIVFLDKLRDDEYGLGPAGEVIPVNEVVYDPATNTAYAKPDAFLDQTRKFALLVTDAVRDPRGQPVVADSAFEGCVTDRPGGTLTRYCNDVSKAVASYASRVAPARVVAATVFTTVSATAFSEMARKIQERTSPALQVSRILPVTDIRGVRWRRQVRTDGDRFSEIDFPAPPSLLALVGVGRVAFGSFQSPDFRLQGVAIPNLPTAAGGMPYPEQPVTLQFHVWLPASPAPAGGYPVVIAGHGFTDSRFGMPTAITAGFMQRGYAIIAINAAGHGYGPDSTLLVTDRNGNTIELPGGGRGVDSNKDGRIDAAEGCLTDGPAALVVLRDCLRQTALDLMQLSRALRSGVDLDGDGRIDLNPDRAGYLGQSLGSYYGTLFLALDPYVRTGVLNVGGGSFTSPLTTSGYRPLLQAALGARVPSLLNLDGRDFDANLPLRYEPVRVNTIPGAIAIQDFLEIAEWTETPGAPYSYATHLSSSTLPDVPIKRALFQYPWGDRTVPNPTETQLVRAANMRETTQFIRYDRLRAAAPSLDRNPHAFLADVIGTPAASALALAAQTQAALWLASGGAQVPDANALMRQAGFDFEVFETPSFLTEELNFLR